jgi:hypothetical protein
VLVPVQEVVVMAQQEAERELPPARVQVQAWRN